MSLAPVFISHIVLRGMKGPTALMDGRARVLLVIGACDSVNDEQRETVVTPVRAASRFQVG